MKEFEDPCDLLARPTGKNSIVVVDDGPLWTHYHKVHLLYTDPPFPSSTLLNPPELS